MTDMRNFFGCAKQGEAIPKLFQLFDELLFGHTVQTFTNHIDEIRLLNMPLAQLLILDASFVAKLLPVSIGMSPNIASCRKVAN
jgi:hypothetical protein